MKLDKFLEQISIPERAVVIKYFSSTTENIGKN